MSIKKEQIGMLAYLIYKDVGSYVNEHQNEFSDYIKEREVDAMKKKERNRKE